MVLDLRIQERRLDAGAVDVAPTPDETTTAPEVTPTVDTPPPEVTTAAPTLTTSADAYARFNFDSGAAMRIHALQTSADETEAADVAPGIEANANAVADAQEEFDVARQTGVPGYVDAAREDVQTAREDLYDAIDQGDIPLDEVNAWYAEQSDDPATRLIVAEVAAEIATDRADATAAEFDVGPNEEGRDQYAGTDETRDARRLEGEMQDELEQVAHETVAAFRAEGYSLEEAVAMARDVAGPRADPLFRDRGDVPSTVGMTEAERFAVYEPLLLENASPEAIEAFERGESVVLGLRDDSTVFENEGRGEFDDRFVVLQQRDDGTVSVREWRASLDPNTQYGAGLREGYAVPEPPEALGPHAHHEGDSRLNPFDDDQIFGWARLSGGQTIRLQEGPEDKLYPPPDGGYDVDIDLDGDGYFDDDATKTIGGNSYQLHGSATGHTGSGGCITVPFHHWPEFRDALVEGQPIVGGDDRAVYLTIV